MPADGPAYPWPDGVASAFAFTVDVDVESPLAWRRKGTRITDLGELEQRRFGARQGLGRLLDLLDRHGIKGSFYFPTADVQRHPHLVHDVASRGHEVGLHGHDHERVDALDRASNAWILDRSLEVFRRDHGIVPTGYRSPSWELTTEVHGLLLERGLAYDSSLMGADHPYTLGGLVEVPVEWLLDDAVFFRYRGGGVEAWPPRAPSTVLEAWTDEFEGVHDAGGSYLLTVHPWISGRASRIRMLDTLLERIVATPGVWCATVAELAEHHVTSGAHERYAYPVTALDARAVGVFAPSATGGEEV